MSLVKDFYGTSVGKKVVMAVTGMILVGFVVSHMLGNLKMFAGLDPVSGQYKMDLYAQMLRSIGAGFFGHETFLWFMRVGLLACIVLHVLSAIGLARLNAAAKPVAVKDQRFGSSTVASRTMLFGGLFLLCFIVFHILHFTTGTTHFSGFEHGAVFANVYRGFQSSAAVAFYVAAMACLSLHLYHGVWSMFQTLGVDSPRWNWGTRALARAVAALLFLGFSSVPVAVKTGLIKGAQPQQAQAGPLLSTEEH